MIAKFALVAWFVGMVALSAGLLAKHLVALPAPETAKLGPAMAALRTSSEHNRWLAVHVLYSECRCSSRVAQHLLDTTRPNDWVEVVLWVGTAAPSAELSRRFDVRQTTSEQLAAYGIEAAPSMVLVDPEGRIHYSGGYTDRKQGPNIEDRRIMSEARQSAVVAALPVFGCAVSDRLRNELSSLPAP